MRVAIDGGVPESVPIGGPLDEFRCARASGKRCVIRTTAGRQYYMYYDLDPLRGKGWELARTRWLPGVFGDWDISPDGLQIAIPNHDSGSARIRVVNLAVDNNRSGEREIVLPGLTDLSGLVCAADGRGWFVTNDGVTGKPLWYAYLDGRLRELPSISGLPIPSPDGHHVAFRDRIITTMHG
jgi:hypothetical protein